MSSINDLFGSDESDSEAERDAERGTSAAALTSRTISAARSRPR